MMKKTLFLILACMMITSVISAQVNVVTYGVSPRQAVADEADIFDLAYNGLENVGTNTKVYFKGLSNVTLVSPTWTLLTKPAGSAAVLGTATAMDTSSEINTMTPDLKGTYKVIFADGANADTVTINAATYVGLANCNACHNNAAFDNVGDKWAGTGHSDIFKRAMDGTLSDHYGPNCVSCHTTGNDPNADNDGFDDRDFVYPSGPDSLNNLTYALLTINSPEAMKLANIQCESCHGPGSEHNAVTTDKKMISSLDVENCAICHDSGTHHAFPDQWKASGHDATEFDGRGFHGGHAVGAFVESAGTRSGCSPCHSGAGYILWVKEGKPIGSGGLPAATSYIPEATNISCAVCHDPHDATSIHQLRLSDTQLGDGTPVTFEKYGTGAQCMECHRSRRVAAEYSSNPASGSSHFGPHHGPQADMLIGKNTPDFGFELPSSAHSRIPNSCVSCHMAGDHVAHDDGSIIHVGGHSFNMNDANGVDNVEACTSCHAAFGESFTEKKYFMNNNADHDGDGVEEGLQEEVHGMLEELATFLPQDADGNVDMSSKTNPVKIVKAGYAYFWVEEDRSFGIHNPALTVSLLKAAIESLKYDATMAGAIQSVTDIPMDQGFQVRLVWTKFTTDDMTSTDKIESYTILREIMAPAAPANIVNYSAIDEINNAEVGNKFMLANAMWDVVAEVPAILYTEYAAVVPTLHNGVETNFKVLGKTKSGIVAETEPMSGMSVDNLAPAVPANLAAAGLGTAIELTWDESMDKDFNYFVIHRGESQGFVPSETNLLANSVDVSYLDNSAGNGKYYYVVAAVDISGNISEFSNEVSATLTDVQLEDAIPTEYALKQNYPNPFNPTTMIKFAIPEASQVKLAIYDVTGREVGLLVNEQMAAGTYSVDWNAVNLSTGIYFYRIEAGSFVNVKKMILIK